MKQITLKSYGVRNIGYYLIVYNSNIGHDIGYYSGVPCFILVVFPWITEHLINKKNECEIFLCNAIDYSMRYVS